MFELIDVTSNDYTISSFFSFCMENEVNFSVEHLPNGHKSLMVDLNWKTHNAGISLASIREGIVKPVVTFCDVGDCNALAEDEMFDSDVEEMRPVCFEHIADFID